MNITKKDILIGTSFFSVGIIIGVSVIYFFLQNQSPKNAYAVREGGYDLINPLLSCDISENKQFKEYEQIANKFQTYIDQHISNGDAQNISVYFRGLKSGYWSGVNENNTYSPASLLKVPMLIAYLKEADSNPALLNEKITYHKTNDANDAETFRSQYHIVEGKVYSINDLLYYLIVYSDNNAAQLLQNHIDPNSLIEVYSDLGIPISNTAIEETLTPKIYSYIFRILYNGTYLSKSMSEYALKLLLSSDFPQGIKAGIPQDVLSAQKFGERTLYTKNSTTNELSLSYRELHDCGIVYYPNNPYILCVMTKGGDFQKLSHVISDISALVYQETKSGILKI